MRLIRSIARYPHPHHSKLVYASDDPKAKVARPSTPQRVGSSSSTPRSLRPIARLPSRAFPPPSPGRSPSSSSIVGKDATGSLEPRASAKKPLLGRSGGLGHAIPLSRREAAEASFVDSEEVGSGVRNDGVDWKLMMRLGMNWYVTPEQRYMKCHSVGSLIEQVKGERFYSNDNHTASLAVTFHRFNRPAFFHTR